MSPVELGARMAQWLASEYQAAVVEGHDQILAYALYRSEPEFIYLRQLFVRPDQRRKGIGRALLRWLWQHSWKDVPRVRVEVLTGNVAGQAFWRALGFSDYCLTLELPRPPA